ncbi:putative aminotransferase YcbU [Sulfodiicoccus acidiphilus]|uniref:Putative aminotransferase YcbU n=1 Tax=Sulfodiicoccus acidiphilus TaxID=1670455 RepID=A0A348B1H6_9CREN|nr:aminotransferase class V-fold PLP-dependent enzyme [Sulfodiicoccus acidiphilus]BBD72028.1 putative aminotransferase YcbU [Sulfodiicoccus acidiphilus]GGU00295.1 putative aminotransferase YcbU [Sulfodiicoccus acidiphilus]
MDTSLIDLMTRNIHLAACSHAPPYREMFESLERYKNDLMEFGNPWDLWVERVKEAKILFSRLIGASPDEVVPHFSVSSALGALLSSFEYGTRDQIVVSDMEYPTTNFIALAQTKYGAKVITLHHANYKLSIEDYSKALTERTLLVSAIHVSSLNGFKQDVKAIIEEAHKVGAYVYVDAYQSAGNTSIDVRKLDVDFLASGTLKYLLGLPGLAFLYVRGDIVDRLRPTYIGWFSQRDPFKFGAEELDYADGADRFQSGTWSVPAIYASIAGMKKILDVGVQRIEEKVKVLTTSAIELGKERGLKTITPEEARERGAIVSFVVDDPHGLENELRRKGVVTSSRGIGLRLAPHFYNTKDDLLRAVELISERSVK